jgi:cell wall-associated NlpC family hydrolase
VIKERSVAEQLMFRIRKFVPRKADCYTFLCDFYQECYEIVLPRYGYDSEFDEKPPDEVWKDWRMVEPWESKPGDILLFSTETGLHLGVLLDDSEFVHVTRLGSPPVRIDKIRYLLPKSIKGYIRYKHGHC